MKLPARRDLAYLFAIWVISRALVGSAFAYAGAHGTWEAALHWDGAWYRSIAEHGYGAVRSGGHSDAAFFPLFPLICAVLVRAGAPFAIAAVVVNNVAMLVALLVVFAYTELRADVATARWACALLCFLPLSLFTVAAYSEGTYLCVSACALLAFERARYAPASMWGALATAARPTGVALAAAFFLEGVRRRRMSAVAAGCVSLLGIIAFALFCARTFGDPFAFARAQQAWRGVLGIDWKAWYAIVQMGFTGRTFVAHAIAIGAIVVLVRRDRLEWVSLLLGALAVGLEAWAWRYNATIVGMLGVGAFALVRFRKRIGATGVVYALCAILLLIISGTPFSVDRNAYAILPIDIALACLARCYPALGYPAVLAMAFGLVYDAAAFARFVWVA